MSLSISSFKDGIAGALHGKNLNKVQSIDSVIYRAACDLLLDIDPRETKRIAPLTNPLFDKVEDVALPSDLKGEKIVDIRPQTKRFLSDNLINRFKGEFELYKKNNTYSIQNNSGVKSLRISKSLLAGVLLNECDSLTANGTWSAAGGASNLETDDIYFVTGNASLKFDVGVTGGYIENSDMTQVDLTDYLLQGSVFLLLYIPDSDALDALQSATLRWGSASGDYYSKTVTQGHFAAFQTGWNLLRFDWSGLSATGSPVITAYDYLRFIVSTDAAVSGFRVDSIIAKLPSIWEIEYYSKYLFRTSAGAWQETISDDSDLINLDTDTYNLLFNKTMYLLAPQVQGEDSKIDFEIYKTEYENGVKKYTGQYKSDAKRQTGHYYRSRRSR